MLLLSFLSFLFGHSQPNRFPPSGKIAFSDTTVEAVHVNLDTASNTWKIEWLKPIQTLRVMVTRIDGKPHLDQTFSDSVNGDFSLPYLTPGIYVLYVHKDNDLPFRLLVQQRGYPEPVSN